MLAADLSFRPVGQQAAQDHQQASQGPNERPSERIALPIPLVVVGCMEQQQALAIEVQPARPLQVQRRRGSPFQGDEAESGIVPEGALKVQLQPGCWGLARLRDRGQPQQVAVNRIRQDAHLGWAVVAQADDLRFVQAFSALSNPSGLAARRGDSAGSGGDGGLDPGLPPRVIGRRGRAQTQGLKIIELAQSAAALPRLACAARDLQEQQLGGLQGPAEAFGGLFKPLSMLGRFPQPGRLIEDHRNRGGGDHPSSQDAVGALLHR